MGKVLRTNTRSAFRPRISMKRVSLEIFGGWGGCGLSSAIANPADIRRATAAPIQRKPMGVPDLSGLWSQGAEKPINCQPLYRHIYIGLDALKSAAQGRSAEKLSFSGAC